MIKLNTILRDKKHNKKKAFTLVEVMLMLLVLSLIIASSTVMITRKHKLKPRKAIHGQYGCFKVKALEADGSNKKDASGNQIYYTHEYMQSGQSILYHHTNDASYGEGVYVADLQCSPELPKSTSYLMVNVIGGGGAGGNANYKYIQPDWDMSKGNAKSLNLVSKEWDKYGVPRAEAKDFDKKTTGNADKDKELTGGVDAAYINSKFGVVPESEVGGGTNYFSWDLFKYIIKDYFKIKVFAYDFAGSGEAGAGVKVTPAAKRNDAVNYNLSPALPTEDERLYDNVKFLCHKKAGGEDASYKTEMFSGADSSDPYYDDGFIKLPQYDKKLETCLHDVFSNVASSGTPMIKRGEYCVVGGNPNMSILEDCPALHLVQELAVASQMNCNGGDPSNGALFTSQVVDYGEGLFAITGKRRKDDTGTAAITPKKEENTCDNYTVDSDVIDRATCKPIYDMGKAYWFNPIRVKWNALYGDAEWKNKCSLDENSALSLVPARAVERISGLIHCNDKPAFGTNSMSYTAPGAPNGDGETITGNPASILDKFLHSLVFTTKTRSWIEEVQAPVGKKYEIEWSNGYEKWVCPVQDYYKSTKHTKTRTVWKNGKLVEETYYTYTYEDSYTVTLHNNREHRPVGYRTPKPYSAHPDECYISEKKDPTYTVKEEDVIGTVPVLNTETKEYMFKDIYPWGIVMDPSDTTNKTPKYFPLDYSKFSDTSLWPNKGVQTVVDSEGNTLFGEFTQADRLYKGSGSVKFPVQPGTMLTDPKNSNSTYDYTGVAGGVFNQDKLRKPENTNNDYILNQTVRRAHGKVPGQSIYAYGIYKIPTIDYNTSIKSYQSKDGAYPYFGEYKDSNYWCQNSSGTKVPCTEMISRTACKSGENCFGTRRQNMTKKDYGVKLHMGVGDAATTIGPTPLKSADDDDVAGGHGANLSRYQVEHLLNMDGTFNTANQTWDKDTHGYQDVADADKDYSGKTNGNKCPLAQAGKAKGNQWVPESWWGHNPRWEYFHESTNRGFSSTYGVDAGRGGRPNTACVGFLGFIFGPESYEAAFKSASDYNKTFYTKHGGLHDILNTTGKTSGKDTFECPYYKASVHRGGDTRSTSMSESEFALNMRYYYQTRSMTYGTPGEPGTVRSMFTRTFSNAKVFAFPADGTEPLNIDLSADQNDGVNAAGVKYSDLRKGKASLFKYACTGDTDDTCRTAVTSAGGTGGTAKVVDPVSNNGRYSNEKVRILNGKYPGHTLNIQDTMFCTSNGPSATNHGAGGNPSGAAASDPTNWCTGGNDEYRAKPSEFSATASMVDIPTDELEVGDAFAPANIGRGGNGGYVANTCWVTPQFFTISNLNLYGTDINGKSYAMEGHEDIKDLAGTIFAFDKDQVEDITYTSGSTTSYRYRAKVKLYSSEGKVVATIPVGDVLANFEVTSLGNKGYTKFADIVPIYNNDGTVKEYTIGLKDETKSIACSDAASKINIDGYTNTTKQRQNPDDHFAFEQQATEGYPGAILIIW